MFTDSHRRVTGSHLAVGVGDRSATRRRAIEAALLCAGASDISISSFKSWLFNPLMRPRSRSPHPAA